MLDYRPVRDGDEHPPVRPAKSGPSLDAREMAGLVLRNFRFLTIVSLIGAVGGGIAGKLITPRFSTSAQIYMDPRSIPGLDKSSPVPSADSTGYINFIESQVRVISSGVVLKKVVQDERLDRDPEFVTDPSMASMLLGAGNAPSTGEGRIDTAMRTFGSHVSVRRPERTFIIEIAVTSRDPVKAARLATAVANAFIVVQSSIQSEKIAGASKSISTRLEAMRQRVMASAQKVEDYKARNHLVGGSDDLYGSQQVRDMRQQLVAARARLDDARSKYDQVRKVRGQPAQFAAIVEALNNQTLVALRARQADAQQQLADLGTGLGPRHPALMAARARLDQVNGLIDRALERLSTSLRSDVDRALDAVSQLEKTLGQVEQTASDAQQASVSLADLERMADADRKIYEGFLNDFRLTSELPDIDTSNIHLITEAPIPVARVYPPGTVVTGGAGLVAGFLLGLALVLLRERGPAHGLPWPPRFDGYLRAVRDFSRPRGEPVRLSLDDTAVFHLRPRDRYRPGLDLTCIGLPVLDVAGERNPLAPVLEKLLTTPSRKPSVVTVLNNGTAKVTTMMALNLALAAVAQEMKVVLFDTRGDLRSAARREPMGGQNFLVTLNSLILAQPTRREASVAEIFDELDRAEGAGLQDLVVCDAPEPSNAGYNRVLARTDAFLVIETDGESKLGEYTEALGEHAARLALLLRLPAQTMGIQREVRRRIS